MVHRGSQLYNYILNMSNFHCRDMSSLKYNDLELPKLHSPNYTHSFLYIKSRKSNLKRNIEHTISNQMQIFPCYRLCLDHCPVTYVHSYIHWVSFYLLKPYILFSSLPTSDIQIKVNFITYYTFITNAANYLTPAHIQLFLIIHR